MCTTSLFDERIAWFDPRHLLIRTIFFIWSSHTYYVRIFLYMCIVNLISYNICNAIMKMNACFIINNSVILETKPHTDTHTHEKIFPTFVRELTYTETAYFCHLNIYIMGRYDSISRLVHTRIYSKSMNLWLTE